MTSPERRPRLATGNEYVSIPDISESTMGIERLGFMHSGFRACVELHGSADRPLLEPVIEIDGQAMSDARSESEQISHWIPQFTRRTDTAAARVTFFAPLERRGFVCLLEVENLRSAPIRVRAGWRGCWDTTFHTAVLSRLMAGVKHAGISTWRPGVPVIEFRGHTPLFAMALVSGDAAQARIWGEEEDSDGAEWTEQSVEAHSGKPVFYELADVREVSPGGKVVVPLYVGIALDEVSAIASGEDLRTHGHAKLLSGLVAWLDRHCIRCGDERFARMLNLNSFYNYFFAQALTLDTEELVVTAARSSRNESCACYRDRDAMRWSLPAVLQVNSAQARKMLIYAFTTQLDNVGVRSRFIDGIVLEPGVQLDQLCAPVRALQMYVQMTGDMSVLFDRRVQAGVNTIQQILGVQRHPEVALFETLLLPSGGLAKYPYVCFSNVLAWRSLLDIGWLYDHVRDLDRAQEAASLAGQVREAIVEHFIVQGIFGSVFAHGIDLQGNHDIGDDPAGSLQLLTHLGFCAPDDPVYVNTMAYIDSESNTCMPGADAAARTSGSSLIRVINDLITGRREAALEFLTRARLDDGIACEYIDPGDGALTGGPAFASCAGLLAFGLRLALDAELPEAAIVEQKRRVSETLYQPPPEPSQDSKKARL